MKDYIRRRTESLWVNIPVIGFHSLRKETNLRRGFTFWAWIWKTVKYFSVQFSPIFERAWFWRFRDSAAVRLRPSVFWNVTQGLLVASYRHFGTVSRFHLQRTSSRRLDWLQWPSKVDCFIHEDGTKKPSRNVVTNHQPTVRNTPEERRPRALPCLKVSSLSPLILIRWLFLRRVVGEKHLPCQYVTLILTGTGPRSTYTNRISTSQSRVSTSRAKDSQSVILTKIIAVYCDRVSACWSC